MRSIAFVFGLVVVAGCGSKPTPLEVCGKLQAAGELKGCAAEAPGGIGAAASAGASGDLPSVAGHSCSILSFKDEATFMQTEAAYQGAAMLVGPHRYGNKAKLVFVQCNDGLDAAHGAKIKAVVDGL